MRYQQHIIVDLEMNPIDKKNKEARKTLYQETIEIGAVRLDNNYHIIDKFSALVKPEYSTVIKATITHITGITTTDVKNEAVFKDVFKQFLEWLDDCPTRIYSWGIADLQQFQNECFFKKIPFPKILKHWINFQAIYPRMLGLPSSCYQMALHNAVEQYGIIFEENKAHRALYDAEKTTELLIPFLSGDYQQYADYIRKTVAKSPSPLTNSLDEASGGKLAALLQRLQAEENEN